MPNKIYDLARMTTATTGTGTITLGSAVSGYLTFAQAGASNGEVVSYAIKDGSNSEIGSGTYTSAGTTLTRTVTKSTNSNAAINLSGTAEVYITIRGEDLYTTASKTDQETATSTTTVVTPAQQQSHPSSPKAMAYYSNSGTVYTNVFSYNVASIVRNSAGNLTITLTTAFASAAYSPTVSSDSQTLIATSFPGTASTIQIRITNLSGTPTDAGFSFVAFGTQ